MEKRNLKKFLSTRFRSESSSFDEDLITGNKVLKTFTSQFYENNRLGHPDYLVRALNAEGRITLSNKTAAPDVNQLRIFHPYHSFFFDTEKENAFSRRVSAAFGHEVRVNRTGTTTVAHLGNTPHFDRLSIEYEQHIINEMPSIEDFGDGVRSYVGILLNLSADPRPVTIIDEPEAFLHPPQAFRLGREMADLASQQNRQVIVATHSADLIKGALSASQQNIHFLFMNHGGNKSYHTVPKTEVKDFSTEPFLVHTDALDALFYRKVIMREADADIMSFKWALEGKEFSLDSIFWIPSYGKSATPNVVKSMTSLGVDVACVFDIDVLLTLDILQKTCDLMGVEISQYSEFLKKLPSFIKIPPAADVLERISREVNDLDTVDDDESRLKAIRSVKKAAEGLSKSWSLKTTGTRLISKGDAQAKISELLEYLAKNGILILREGEIENYAPTLGGHGRSWVRQVIEAGKLDISMRTSLVDQFSLLLAESEAGNSSGYGAIG